MGETVLRILEKAPPQPLMPGHVTQREYGLAKVRGDGRVHFAVTLHTFASRLDSWPIMELVVTDCGVEDGYNPRLLPERQLETLYVDQYDLSRIARFCRKCWTLPDGDTDAR